MHSKERRVCYFKGLIFALLFCVRHGLLKLLHYKLATQMFHHGSTHPHQCSSIAVPTHTSGPAWQYPPTQVFHHGSTHPHQCSSMAVPTHTSGPAWQYHPHQCSSMVSYTYQCFTMATFTRVRIHSLPFLFIWFLSTQVGYEFKS